MKNENKCFFSISLENGITITGNSPEEVVDYLIDLRIAVIQARNDEKNNDNNPFWVERFDQMRSELTEALLTIYNNTKKTEK